MDRKPRVRHCKDERIATSKSPICTKLVQSAAEMLVNQCRNCGRPFVSPEDVALHDSLGGEE